MNWHAAPTCCARAPRPPGAPGDDIEICVWPGSSIPQRELDVGVDAALPRRRGDPRSSLAPGSRNLLICNDFPSRSGVFAPCCWKPPREFRTRPGHHPGRGGASRRGGRRLARTLAPGLPARCRRAGASTCAAWRGFTEDPEQAVVVIQWKVATVEGFFASRGRVDAAVTDFWEATDRLAISRNRRVLEDAGIASMNRWVLLVSFQPAAPPESCPGLAGGRRCSPGR